MESNDEHILHLNKNLNHIAKQLEKLNEKLDEWTHEGCLATFECNLAAEEE